MLVVNCKEKSNELATKEIILLFYCSLQSTSKTNPGHPAVFDKEEQEMMQYFLMDCHSLRMPRTEDDFARDIQLYVNHTGKKVPFKNGLPGINHFT